jgi:hypothetical protein
MGHSPAGLFGFSHMLGGYSGGQAEYLRVPMADVADQVPDSVSDEQALFLSDIPNRLHGGRKRSDSARRHGCDLRLWTRWAVCHSLCIDDGRGARHCIR